MSKISTHDICPACEKPAGLCICEAVSPIDNAIEVIVLRHPQEQDRVLGTARILALQLKNSSVKTGLSWPNLAKLVGRAADPRRWGVLYLGTAKSSAPQGDRVLSAVTKDGEALPDQEIALSRLEGIILLDGNWAQAKALWWRNAWMLKCCRLVLAPQKPSLYGSLRREPRRESISTIEAAALALAELQSEPDLAERILPPFRLLLDKARRQEAQPDAPAPARRWTS